MEERQQLYTPEVISVPLPSEGKVYEIGSSLHGRKEIDIREMTANEENVLTSVNMVRRGTAIDKVVKQCIIDKDIDPQQLIVGDRNSIMIGLVLASYGNEYKTEVRCPVCDTVTKDYAFNINELPVKPLKVEPVEPGKNEFDFTLPKSGLKITFKIATAADQNQIRTTADRLKQVAKLEEDVYITTSLKQLILSVDGQHNPSFIAELIDRGRLPIRDSNAIRAYIDEISPDVVTDQEFSCNTCGADSNITMPISFDFFWRSGK